MEHGELLVVRTLEVVQHRCLAFHGLARRDIYNAQRDTCTLQVINASSRTGKRNKLKRLSGSTGAESFTIIWADMVQNTITMQTCPGAGAAVSSLGGRVATITVHC